MALGRRLLQKGVWAVKRIAEALGISRPQMSANRQERPPSTQRSSYIKEDKLLLECIRALVSERPTYGYRRVTALLNREQKEPRVSHKLFYRVMKQAGLLIPKYTGGIERSRTGEVITLKSNLRWALRFDVGSERRFLWPQTSNHTRLFPGVQWYVRGLRQNLQARLRISRGPLECQSGTR